MALLALHFLTYHASVLLKILILVHHTVSIVVAKLLWFIVMEVVIRVSSTAVSPKFYSPSQ